MMSAHARDSIVITGCGWVTPLGAGTITTVFAAHRQAHAAPGRAHDFWPAPRELEAEGVKLKGELKSDPGARMTAVALATALADARLELASLDATRIGLVLGCALAGPVGMIGFADEVRAQSARFVSPLHFPQTVGNYVAGALARGFDIRGPNLTLASGPASGLDAVVEGGALLLDGTADVVLAGGTTLLTPQLVAGLPQPGVAYSDGACLFVLERADSAAARGVTPLAIVLHTDRRPTEAIARNMPLDAIVSSAGNHHAGALSIEHWVGRCLGTTSAAALAAAIGAADGAGVPIIDNDQTGSVTIQPCSACAPATTDSAVSALVLAAADESHVTNVELSVTRPSPAHEAQGDMPSES